MTILQRVVSVGVLWCLEMFPLNAFSHSAWLPKASWH